MSRILDRDGFKNFSPGNYCEQINAGKIFTTTQQGGIFARLDGDFSRFNARKKPRPKVMVSPYKFLKDIKEPDIAYYTRQISLYQEMYLNEISSVCHAHITCKYPILSETASNLFFIRDNDGILCRISVFKFLGREWFAQVREFIMHPPRLWKAGFVCFLKSKSELNTN